MRFIVMNRSGPGDMDRSLSSVLTSAIAMCPVSSKAGAGAAVSLSVSAAQLQQQQYMVFSPLVDPSLVLLAGHDL